jgi:probable F420-dependent oxidoreductase
MKLGFNLPQVGPAAGIDGIQQVAQRAEELGFDSVWVTDRVLFPLDPQSGYGGFAGNPIPEPYKIVIDPVLALTYAAAITNRVRLGASALVAPYYTPILLARSLTSLDVLSNGRLEVAFGQGWSKDESDAAGVSMGDRGKRAEDTIAALLAIWSSDEVEYQGNTFNIPRSIILPKPVQKPHPPIYVAGFSPKAIGRAVRLADGWNPVGNPPPEAWEQVRDSARAAGKPDFKLIVRANLHITDAPITENRWPFTGSLEQIQGDFQAAEALGAETVFVDPTFSPHGASVEGFLEVMEMIPTLTNRAAVNR